MFPVRWVSIQANTFIWADTWREFSVCRTCKVSTNNNNDENPDSCVKDRQICAQSPECRGRSDPQRPQIYQLFYDQHKERSAAIISMLLIGLAGWVSG